MTRSTDCQRQRRKREPKKKAASIPHEDGCGIGVVEQKATGGTQHNGQVSRLGKDVRATGETHEEPGAGNNHRSGTQAIHVVEEIEGIGQADQPHHRQQHVDSGSVGPVKTLAKKHEQRRQRDLSNQLGGRLQRQHIVSHTNEEDEGSSDERQGKNSEIPGDQGQSDNRDCDGHTAEKRRWPTVPSILARPSDEALPDSNGATDGDERSRDGESDDVPGNYGQGTNR